MRDVAIAAVAAQQNSIAATSAVLKVPLILLPKRLDGITNASSVPSHRHDQAIEIKV
jgi:hypothetical protein